MTPRGERCLQVYGTLTITSAASEETVTHYHLYYGALELRSGRCEDVGLGYDVVT